ncbi:hypothetical protein GCM10022384_62670 [Streptomyces marokkonensis]|uniref:Uncharacterized protein n=1 Tax=Streptomyces marokkonensis TaxID=324855 RepID=A0ABP7S8X0_9ACTN
MKTIVFNNVSLGMVKLESMPPHISAARVKGFASAAGRTVLDGGFGKMLDVTDAPAIDLS